MVQELYAKMFEKMTKIRLDKKRYNFETKQKFYLKIDTTILKPVCILYQTLKFLSFELIEKQTISEKFKSYI